MNVQWMDKKTCIFQNVLFLVQKKESHTVLERHEGEWMMTDFVLMKRCFETSVFTARILNCFVHFRIHKVNSNIFEFTLTFLWNNYTKFTEKINKIKALLSCILGTMKPLYSSAV